MDWFLENRPHFARTCGHSTALGHRDRRLLSVVSPDRLVRILARVFDECEFLSPFGVRGLSRWHHDHPFVVDIDGVHASVDYEPAESTSGLFGGNSNWRGPVWFPVNYLLIDALRTHASFLGDGWTIEYPTGSGTQRSLRWIADDLSRRLVGLFLPVSPADQSGHRPVWGTPTGPAARPLDDPRWRDLIPFFEYFNGDTGQGLGASHQTGWTALVINLLLGC
jgi:hypothetical protein